MKIKLNDLYWFAQKQGDWWLTNVQTGSLGTDPNTGCLNRAIFNYAVRVLMEDKEVNGKTKPQPCAIVAECFVRLPISEGCERKNEVSCQFDFSEAGLSEAADWLDFQLSENLN